MAAGAAASPRRKMFSIRQPRSPTSCSQILSAGTWIGKDPGSEAARIGMTPFAFRTVDHTSHNMADARRAASISPIKRARRVLTRPATGGFAKMQTGISVKIFFYGSGRMWGRSILITNDSCFAGGEAIIAIDRRSSIRRPRYNRSSDRRAELDREQVDGMTRCSTRNSDLGWVVPTSG